MTSIVITGSTRGIGFSLARAFLERGCDVMINGRTAQAVEASEAALSAGAGGDRVAGQAADVTDYDQMLALWGAASRRFGRVDIWINNAGIGHRPMPPWELPAAAVRDVVATNLIGAMYGSMVALQGMLAQGGGTIYNVEGMGSDGRRHAGLTFYGTTKYGLRYFNQALAEEAQGTPVKVGALRPGMILTDLVVGQYRGRPQEWERVRPIFDIIADRLETVVPWMADRVLANRETGEDITWMSRPRLVWRFLTSPVIRRHTTEGIDPERPDDHR